MRAIYNHSYISYQEFFLKKMWKQLNEDLSQLEITLFINVNSFR